MKIDCEPRLESVIRSYAASLNPAEQNSLSVLGLRALCPGLAVGISGSYSGEGSMSFIIGSRNESDIVLLRRDDIEWIHTKLGEILQAAREVDEDEHRVRVTDAGPDDTGGVQP